MALSDGEIEWALDIGALVIDPEPPRGADGRIKGACADLLLDDTLWVPQSGRAGDFTLNLDSIDSEQFILDHSDEHKINETQGYDLLPKGFIIGRTAESIQTGHAFVRSRRGSEQVCKVGHRRARNRTQDRPRIFGTDHARNLQLGVVQVQAHIGDGDSDLDARLAR